MTQTGLSFWEFAIAVQAKNSLLHGTTSYLDQKPLCHPIESGMSQKLALRCRLSKSNEKEDFKEWLTEVKHVDDLVHAECAYFESLAKATRDSSCRNNALAEPSRRANMSFAISSTRISLPKLTEIERKLLYDNDGCLKCHHVFVNHRSPACPNDFPDPTTYKPITQASIDAITKCSKHNIVAAVAPTKPASPSALPVAVVMGASSNPVAYMPSYPFNVIATTPTRP
jgi:hypothetical protein